MSSPELTQEAKRIAAVWHIGGEDLHLRIPLLLELRKRGFQVGAVGSEDGKLFAQHDIRYWRYPLERGISPLADYRARRRLVELFSHQRPDIVHAFDTKPAIMAPFAALEAKVRGRVRTIAGMGYIFSSASPLALLLQPIYRHLQRRASSAASLTVFQNPDDQAYFRRHRMVSASRDALVLGSGVNVDELSSQRPDDVQMARIRQKLAGHDRLIVTMVARLVRHKGVREFLQAAKMLRRRGSEAQFLLVGPVDTEGRQAISLSEIEEYGNEVCYLGPRNDVPALLAASDIFALPSYYREGVPRALLEAGAMELPLITTDTPGCREVVRDGINGLLVPPRNANALAEAIERLLGSAQLREKMARASNQHVRRHFDLANVADAYAKIYQRVLSEG